VNQEGVIGEISATATVSASRYPVSLHIASQRLRPAFYLLPAGVLISTFLVWPMVWIVGMSFTQWDGLGPIHWVGLDTWKQLFSDPTFRAALRNSVLWVGLSCVLPPSFGFALALLFARAHAWIGALGRALAVLPLLLPLVVTAVTFHLIYNPDTGPLDRLLALMHLPQPDWLGDPTIAIWSLFAVMLWASLGLSVLVFTGALRSIDRSYFDLVRLEGASFVGEFRYVILPACRKTAALAIVATVVLTSAVFDLLIVLTTWTNDTIMLPMDMYNRMTGPNVSSGAAEATLQVIAGAVLAVIVFKLAGPQSGMSGDDTGSPPRSNRVASITVACICIVLALPLLWDLSSALTSGADIINPPTFPWPPDFSSFGIAWSEGMFGSSLFTSAVLGLAVVALTLTLAVPAAFGLSDPRLARTARATILAILVFSVLLPGEPYLIPVFYLVHQLGLGELTGLLLAESARELPFAILLLWVFAGSLPTDILGAAELEAGRGMRMLTHVVVPLTAPIFAAVGVWVFITSWSEVPLANMLLTTANVETAPVALSNFAGTVDTQVSLLAAGSLLLVAPVALVLLIAYGPAARGLKIAGRAIT
jgi:ABC-type sugar transport system permease subunit